MVQAEFEALTRAGHDVRLFAAYTDDLGAGRIYALRAGVRTATGIGSNPLGCIEAFRPEITRIHNLFPNFGTRWVRALPGEVHAVIHNFRMVCSNGTLFRNGQICTACPDGARWSGVRNGCYRESSLATIPVTVGPSRGVRGNPVVERADRLILLSELQKEVLARYGLDTEKVEVWPNFLPSPLDHGSELVPDAQRSGWVFVGRLSPEKGILELLRSWPEGHHLTVVGNGPLRPQVEAEAQGRGINVVGQASRLQALDYVSRAIGLVFPSRGVEVAGLVYLEALSVGTPVLTLRQTAIATEVERDGTGFVADKVKDLIDAVSGWQAGAVSGQRCRAIFDALYTERHFISRIGALRTTAARR